MSESLESIPALQVSAIGGAVAAGAGNAGKGSGQQSTFVLPRKNGWRNKENKLAGIAADSMNLSPEARAQLRELKQRDAEVRAHEQAHIAAGGQYISGGARYDYQKGPDGRQYAIGGHVDIDVSKISGDPEATRQKADQVRRAATAPGEPSDQDRLVAAKAAQIKAEATREAANASDATGRAPSASPGSFEAIGINGQQAEQAGPGDWARLHAAHVYADMSMQGVMPTALAPGGTGISLKV